MIMNQTFTSPEPPTRPCSFAPDGLVGGVNGQYLVAVQWHPEELAGEHANMRRLFTDFVGAARESRR